MRVHRSWFSIGLLGTMAALLSACATVPPRPVNLASSALLTPTRTMNTPYHFRRPGVDFATYNSIVMAPVKMAFAAGSTSNAVTPGEQAQLAKELQQQFTAALSQHFRIAAAPGSRNLLVQLTLLDAAKSNSVMSTVSHVLPVGLVINAGAQMAGRHGTFAGSVLYAVEVRDTQTGDILYAEVANQSAKALNIAASVTPLGAASAGIRVGAESFVEQLLKKAP
ncbi:DUF3313 domain-containing protein [Rhizobium sp. FY34]|uniref:DUF3313 domain-containing protein n=1 Tax=Rhizobium sp. FY34 TaxID=2562309 RepID=UPI0010BFC51C|nr:DUF3313 domain-containing protein [Rhizobium sp. FY34]